MTIKLVVFDMDGVLINEKCYASKLFEEKYNIPHKEFYSVLKKNKFLERTKDQGPTFGLFNDFFEKYDVDITEQEFWNLWLNNFKVEEDLLELAFSLKKSGKKIGIVSDNPHERAKYLISLDWVKKFDHVLFSCYYGVTKKNPRLFEILVEKSGLKPEEIFFTDDDEKNVKVARSIGINAEIYNNLEQLNNKLKSIGL